MGKLKLSPENIKMERVEVLFPIENVSFEIASTIFLSLFHVEGKYKCEIS